MNLTIDSSVIIAALRRQETKHEACKALLAQLNDEEHRAFESVILPVEVAAAIRRRTSSEELARQVWENLLRLPFLFLVELTRPRMESAARIAEKTGLRGMDAIIVQVAAENEATLVTLDGEMADKGKEIITVEEVETLLDELKAA